MVAFLACAVFGAVLLVALLVAGGGSADGGTEAAHDASAAHAGAGAGHDAEHHDGGLVSLAMSLVGLRPFAAAVAFFGLAGAAVRARGGDVTAALLVAAPVGLVAAVLTALLLRTLLRFESDGTVRLERALGSSATVYVPIPAGGAGKVQLALQGRLVECSATAADRVTYPTGARVLVVDVTPDGGLLVAADPAAPATPAARGGLPSPRSAAL
jgi:membrane protein implicated in regulation of membrane protease activity